MFLAMTQDEAKVHCWCELNDTVTEKLDSLGESVMNLLSWSPHVDPRCGSMRTFSDRKIYTDAPAIQLHAIGSLHRLENKSAQKMSQDFCWITQLSKASQYDAQNHSPWWLAKWRLTGGER